jgi:hypothetical protein
MQNSYGLIIAHCCWPFIIPKKLEYAPFHHIPVFACRFVTVLVNVIAILDTILGQTAAAQDVEAVFTVEHR